MKSFFRVFWLLYSVSLLTYKSSFAESPALPKIDTANRFQVSHADGRSSFRVGGRLHLDGAIYSNDKTSHFTNGFDARRSRIEFQGTMYQHWNWKFDFEFGQVTEIKSGFRDVFIRVGFPESFSYLTIGQFKEYYGLEHMNSSNDLPLVERALPSRVFHDIAESSDGRRLGIGWNTHNQNNLTFGLGIFSRNISGSSTDSIGDSFSLQSRGTFSPLHQPSKAIHIGVSANWLDLNDSGRATLSSRPESRIGAEPLIKTGTISNSDSLARYSIEGGWIRESLWAQAEYNMSTIYRSVGPTVWFFGHYLYVGYVLTGEGRVYDFEKGTFKNPQVQTGENGGSWGVWEVVARQSFLSLNDEDIRGGKESNISLGVNWYPNNNFRFMATATKVLMVSEGSHDGATPSEFLLRAQFAF